MLAKVMQVDPYFVTQDNGAGAPLHFAVTYRQLDMVHHLLGCGALVNQRDERGLTPLHRAAALAHLDGYRELYEYLLSRGADPSIPSDDYDPYLSPGSKLPVDMAADEEARQQLELLHRRYSDVPKEPLPHPDVGDWWALYDYGLQAVSSWAADYKHPYPEERKREADRVAQLAARQRRRAARAAALATIAAAPSLPYVPPAAAASTALTQAAVVASRDVAPPLDSPVAFLFPGQGSQALGMISPEVAALPAVADMLRTAHRVLGYDLLELCTTGPRELLDDTSVSQPALYVAAAAAVEALRLKDPAAAASCSAAAGLSLGEYAALVFAGALSFENGLRVVKVRGEAMAAAAQQGRPHGMLSVVGTSDQQLEGICADVRRRLGPDTVCQLANYLFPQGRAVSGHTDALDLVSKAAIEAGALKASRLPVSGAFHTPLMAPASRALEQALAGVQVLPPRLPVFSNVTAGPFPSDPDAIRQLLARQLVEPVQWERTLRALLAAGKGRMHELGPGQQIKAMVRRIDKDAWSAFVNMSA